MAIRVATAPDSWGVWFPADPHQTPWNRFLDEVAEAGYDAIELGPYGYLPTDPARLRRELESRGLRLTGAFIFRDLVDADAWEETRSEVDSLTRVVLEMGAEHLVLINTLYTDLFTGARVGPPALSDAAWSTMVDTISRIGELTRSRGVTAVYHPHVETVVEHLDQVERLLRDVDAELVSLCLDLGHIAYRGGDPIDLMTRYPERVRYLHLKNVDPAKRASAVAEGWSFSEAVRQGTFCELESGAIDYARVRDAIPASFDGWGVVEQDMYPCAFDEPLPVARRNRDYLRRIGMG